MTFCVLADVGRPQTVIDKYFLLFFAPNPNTIKAAFLRAAFLF
jgi:hypothetical protein